MAKSTPTVTNGLLTTPTGYQIDLATDPAAWQAWLQAATSFRYVSTAGRFTAVKETRRGRGSYWTASRRGSPHRLHRHYLGLTPALTLAALETAAQTLQAAIDQERPRRRPSGGDHG